MAYTSIPDDKGIGKTELTRLVEIALPLLVGVVWFFLFASPQLLNPLNSAWLQVGDPAANYLGWRYFMESPWTFPPGLNPEFGIELSRSIVYSDAFPLLAITTKAFAPILPEGFHLFGIWILAIFVLQAIFAAKLVGLVTTDRLITALGTVFFVGAPVLLHRLTGEGTMHLALSSHFLILAMLYAFLRPASERTSTFWIALLAVTLLTHFYLFAIIGIFWWADLKRSLGRNIITTKAFNIEMASAVAIVVALGYLAGYFAGDTAKAPGFGQFAMNFYAFFDANGWSFVMPDLAGRYGDYEGFQYLGLGVLLGLLIGGVLLATGRVQAPDVDRSKLWTIAPFVLVLVLAITNRIGVGPNEVTIPLPEFVIDFANILRASGRMAWPFYYALILGMIFLLVRGLPKKAATGTIAALLAIQLADTSAMWANPVKNPLRAPATGEWTNNLTDPVWRQIGGRYDVLRMAKASNQAKQWSDLAYFSLRNDMSTNVVYLARIEDDMLAANDAEMARRFAQADYANDTVYIIDETQLDAVRATLDPQRDGLREADGFYLLTPGWPNSQ